jgi:hypothetical protein
VVEVFELEVVVKVALKVVYVVEVVVGVLEVDSVVDSKLIEVNEVSVDCLVNSFIDSDCLVKSDLLRLL